MSKNYTFGVKGTKLTPQSIVFGVGKNDAGEQVINLKSGDILYETKRMIEKKWRGYGEGKAYDLICELDRNDGNISFPLPLSDLRGDDSALCGRKILHAMGIDDETLSLAIDKINAKDVEYLKYAEKEASQNSKILLAMGISTDEQLDQALQNLKGLNAQNLTRELQETVRKAQSSKEYLEEQKSKVPRPITAEHIEIILPFVTEVTREIVTKKMTSNFSNVAIKSSFLAGGVLATLLTLAAQKFTGDDCDTSAVPTDPVAEEQATLTPTAP